MFTSRLSTHRPDIALIEPDIERDAPLSVHWLADPHGRETLRLMGVPERDNTPSTLPEERSRIRSFLENTGQLNWMMAIDNKVVGAVWVDLHSTNEVPGPAVHIMIGDPEQRGRGAGRAALQAVIDYLRLTPGQDIYSRHITADSGAALLLQTCGFQPYNDPYIDKDGLQWQNVVLA